ncbi:hypothetical protein [Streptomyces cinereospinus]|uniref:Uncharacterized protein n=1 Tax=Streptomyces cinereospinus TaxID=285561 RepID=A0ABV5NAY2_9ACTN
MRLEQHRTLPDSTRRLAAERRDQQVDRIRTRVRDELLGALHAHPAVRSVTAGLAAEARAGTVTPTLATERILRPVRAAPRRPR